ncbi:MAG: 4-alpha-glucanotransferase [Planctomycetota bacterium]
MSFPRTSGILCHVTSLPRGADQDATPVGDLGPGAYEFVDWLAQAGQSIWQILPLSPPAANDSPYSAYSAFAGNPLLISPELMVREGWLLPSDLPTGLGHDGDRVDYPAAAQRIDHCLQIGLDRFLNSSATDRHQDFEAFRNRHPWLDDFSIFEAIMLQRCQSDWNAWPMPIVLREPHAIAEVRRDLNDAITLSQFKQFMFDRQWFALKAYANNRGVRLVGDMPIFVAHESADVWANQSLFALDSHGRAKLVAGVPPDYFSKTGQRWGNPQYRWDVLAQHGYRWWIDRFSRALNQYDLLRVDHFRGFEAYWEIPATAPTAVEGRWRSGPGSAPFDAATEELGALPLIAEDLGMITEAVHQLRDDLGFPGMRVMQFGFDDPNDDFHRPDSWLEHSVAYTGTHDNDTVMGWYHGRNRKISDADLLSAIVTAEDEIHWQLIDAVLHSRSNTAIMPIQDCLGLGNDARMNVPGQAEGNWTWRLTPGQLNSDLAFRLRDATITSQRVPAQRDGDDQTLATAAVSTTVKSFD